MSSAPVAPTSTTHRSRITNGSAMLPGVDGRSMIARRYRDLVRGLEAEHGGPISEAARLQIRTAASMQVHVEDMTARMARGEAVSPEEMTRASNGAIRALAAIRSSRPSARRRGTPEGLRDYLSARQPEAA